MGGVFLLVIILFLGFIAGASFLNFKEIKISGSSRIAGADILANLRVEKLKNPFARYLGYGNMILWRDGELDLGDDFPVRVIAENNVWERILEIKVEDRVRFLVWCRSERCYWVDDAGIVLEPAPIAEGQLISVVYDGGGNALVPGIGVFEDDSRFLRLKNILEIVGKNKIPVSKILIDGDDVNMGTMWGTDFLFSLRFDSFFVKALDQLMTRIKISKMAYIDFRVENKIYYKARD